MSRVLGLFFFLLFFFLLISLITLFYSIYSSLTHLPPYNDKKSRKDTNRGGGRRWWWPNDNGRTRGQAVRMMAGKFKGRDGGNGHGLGLETSPRWVFLYCLFILLLISYLQANYHHHHHLNTQGREQQAQGTTDDSRGSRCIASQARWIFFSLSSNFLITIITVYTGRKL